MRSTSFIHFLKLSVVFWLHLVFWGGFTLEFFLYVCMYGFYVQISVDHFSAFSFASEKQGLVFTPTDSVGRHHSQLHIKSKKRCCRVEKIEAVSAQSEWRSCSQTAHRLQN